MAYGSVNVPGDLSGKQNKLTGQPGQAVGFDSDKNAAAVQGWSNTNLIDNPNFAINRTGVTTAKVRGRKYFMDRWLADRADIEVLSAGEGLAFACIPTSYTDNGYISYQLRVEQILGDMVTASALIDGMLYVITASVKHTSVKDLGSKINDIRIDIEWDFTTDYNQYSTCRVVIRNYSETAKTVKAVKLELGSQQTLAHQDSDGNWVLNDPVCYEAEYAKCAQYDPQTGEWIGYKKPVQDMAQLALQSICPTNHFLYDDAGKPGVYVQRAPRLLQDLLNGGDDSIHPAFLVNDIQVAKLMIGKFQGKADGGRIYSLPGEDTTTNITLDQYELYCKNKGDGHHCITAAEWAFLALCAKKDGRMPKGNNNYGKDISETSYVAIPAPGVQDNGKTARTLTGTGPLAWSDTGDLTGIFDLNGNIWEWVAGIRLVFGELQVIPQNDAADPECDTSASSNRWKAINAAATGYADLFVTPNGQGTTAGTVKLDYVSNHWQWQSTAIANKGAHNAAFAATTYASGISAFCKMYLQAMALGPDDGAVADDYNGDKFWANTGEAERCAFRGGDWRSGALGGVFALSFDYPRSYQGAHLGGRPAFYE